MKRKHLVIGVIVTGIILGGITLIKPKTVEYIQGETQIVEVEKEIETLTKRIERAQNASSTEIEAEAQKAFSERKEQLLKEIELEVTRAYREEIEARENELEKQTQQYWRSKSRIISIIKEHFPDDTERAIQVAQCESGLNPYAVNKKNKNGTVDGGVFQINSTHDKRLNALGLDKFNPEHNVRFARILYEEQGWQPWVCARKAHLSFVH